MQSAKHRVLLDTNILLDIAFPGRPEHESAKELFKRVCLKSVTAFVTAGSLKDFYYVARKDADDEKRRKWITTFTDAAFVSPLDGSTIQQAIESDEPDFEDAIVRVSAEKEQVDFIITRDEGAFSESALASSTAAGFLELIKR